jgi:hypothetical protein
MSPARATELARIATAVLFHSDYSKIDAKDLIEALRGDPRLTLCAGEEVVGKRLSILAVAHGLAPSHGKSHLSPGGGIGSTILTIHLALLQLQQRP